MIEIEFEKPNVYKCECCGNEIKKLTRFVYKNDDAHAVYYAQFTKGHEDKIVYGIISLGEWGEDGEPKDRVAFPFKIRTNKNDYLVELMDKEDSPWKGVELLGQILNRKESLKHEWVKEIFHITDHIVSEDKEIIHFFN